MRIKVALLKLDFKTALNFLMAPQDFAQMYSIFYHAVQMTEYSIDLFTDSLFSADELKLADLGQSHSSSQRFKSQKCLLKEETARL